MGLVVAVALAGLATAQEVLPPEPGIETTIRSQTDAFLRNDLNTAFGYAAPSIRGMFGTPENFAAMARNGYPVVWRPEILRFGELVDLPGGVAQTVVVTDAAGVGHSLEYRMTPTDDG